MLKHFGNHHFKIPVVRRSGIVLRKSRCQEKQSAERSSSDGFDKLATLGIPEPQRLIVTARGVFRAKLFRASEASLIRGKRRLLSG